MGLTGRSGVVAVVGRTNVGKSTLVNRLVGEKVSIVSAVVQTTRNRIRAVLTESRGQLVLIDTPGVHKARTHLGTLMNRMARGSIAGTDVALLVLDASARPCREDAGWIALLARHAVPWIAVLNKIDRAADYTDEYRRLELAPESGASAHPVARAVCWKAISAASGDGCEALLDTLFGLLPEGPPLFPEALLSDYPEKLAMADIIREKLVVRLRDELPHAVAVRVDTLEKQPEGIKVGAAVYVDRPSQKGIVIGHKGRVLRAVRRQAEVELSDIYETHVALDLWVKVEPDWQQNYWMLRQLGYTDR